MKAKLSRDGILTVKAENGTESYALKKWIIDNAKRVGTKWNLTIVSDIKTSRKPYKEK